ncbi:hypothetical protein GCM10009429_29190 [Dyella marensis]
MESRITVISRVSDCSPLPNVVGEFDDRQMIGAAAVAGGLPGLPRFQRGKLAAAFDGGEVVRHGLLEMPHARRRVGIGEAPVDVGGEHAYAARFPGIDGQVRFGSRAEQPGDLAARIGGGSRGGENSDRQAGIEQRAGFIQCLVVLQRPGVDQNDVERAVAGWRGLDAVIERLASEARVVAFETGVSRA